VPVGLAIASTYGDRDKLTRTSVTEEETGSLLTGWIPASVCWPPPVITDVVVPASARWKEGLQRGLAITILGRNFGTPAGWVDRGYDWQTATGPNPHVRVWVGTGKHRKKCDPAGEGVFGWESNTKITCRFDPLVGKFRDKHDVELEIFGQFVQVRDAVYRSPPEVHAVKAASQADRYDISGGECTSEPPECNTAWMSPDRYCDALRGCPTTGTSDPAHISAVGNEALATFELSSA
jgi:hypothetical protein